MAYDGDGKRRRIEDSGGLRNIIWDMENILVETDSNDATAAAYTLAPEMYGELVSQRRSGATSFHHFDALGSTNKLTDANAATVAEYLYKAFGEQTVVSGSSPNRFTWVGKLGYYRQPDAADYWVRARIMKPGPGRWLSRDPLCLFSRSGRVSNCYLYCSNILGRDCDPSGLKCPRECIWGVANCRDLRKPPWAAKRHDKPRSDCNQARLRVSIDYAWCMMMLHCYNSWPRFCSQFGGPGEGTTLAETFCCEDECGRCESRTYYSKAYNDEMGCEQYCTKRHETIHREDCRSANKERCKGSECDAYTDTWNCLKGFLR
jgi:RHS repeat-associated protein